MHCNKRHSYTCEEHHGDMHAITGWLQIPATITEAELRNLFACFGNIVELHLLKKGVGAGEICRNMK